MARIIFDELKGDDTSSETGYGISIYEHGDIEILIEILPEQIIRIGDKYFTFDEFIK